MDYQRIYNEFIADRKAKATPGGYIEKHHTVRSFRHDDGRVEFLTKFEMAAKFGLNRTCLNYVINGARKQTQGWSYGGEATRP